MTLPSWLTKEMEDKLMAHRLARPEIFLDQARLLTGLLLNYMLSNIQDKIQSAQAKPKIHVYSAHDTNIHALMTSLRLHMEQQIPYAAAFIVELHEQDGHHFVKFLYISDDEIPPKILIIPGCGKILCPLGKFIKLYGASIMEKWNEMCIETSHDSENEKPMNFEEMFPYLSVGLILLFSLILFYQAFLYYFVSAFYAESKEEEDKIDNTSEMSPQGFYGEYDGGSTVYAKKRKMDS